MSDGDCTTNNLGSNHYKFQFVPITICNTIPLRPLPPPSVATFHRDSSLQGAFESVFPDYLPPHNNLKPRAFLPVPENDALQFVCLAGESSSSSTIEASGPRVNTIATKLFGSTTNIHGNCVVVTTDTRMSIALERKTNIVAQFAYEPFVTLWEKATGLRLPLSEDDDKYDPDVCRMCLKPYRNRDRGDYNDLSIRSYNRYCCCRGPNTGPVLINWSTVISVPTFACLPGSPQSPESTTAESTSPP